MDHNMLLQHIFPTTGNPRKMTCVRFARLNLTVRLGIVPRPLRQDKSRSGNFLFFHQFLVKIIVTTKILRDDSESTDSRCERSRMLVGIAAGFIQWRFLNNRTIVWYHTIPTETIQQTMQPIKKRSAAMKDIVTVVGPNVDLIGREPCRVC